MKSFSLSSIQKRLDYFKSALKSMHEYGGTPEMCRGALRFALQKPSNTLRSLRWHAMHLGSNVEQEILDFHQFKLIVDANDQGISAELALDQMHEPFGTEILLSILKDQMTIVELGANIGYYTMQESCRRKLKRVVAIEPNPASFKTLSENVALNHCDHVSLHNIGISDINGSLPFYISAHSNICSMTPRTDCIQTLDVPVMTLDDFLQKEQIQNIDMIRMDIEGHEICALRGMKQTLSLYHPWICMEYHAPMISSENRDEFIQTLESLDYELKCFTFRWSDYPIFGKNIVDKNNIIKFGNLRDVLNNIPKQVLLLFLAPKSTEFIPPTL